MMKNVELHTMLTVFVKYVDLTSLVKKRFNASNVLKSKRPYLELS